MRGLASPLSSGSLIDSPKPELDEPIFPSARGYRIRHKTKSRLSPATEIITTIGAGAVEAISQITSRGARKQRGPPNRKVGGE
jgi:hypothetical protein